MLVRINHSLIKIIKFGYFLINRVGLNRKVPFNVIKYPRNLFTNLANKQKHLLIVRL